MRGINIDHLSWLFVLGAYIYLIYGSSTETPLVYPISIPQAGGPMQPHTALAYNLTARTVKEVVSRASFRFEVLPQPVILYTYQKLKLPRQTDHSGLEKCADLKCDIKNVDGEVVDTISVSCRDSVTSAIKIRFTPGGQAVDCVLRWEHATAYYSIDGSVEMNFVVAAEGYCAGNSNTSTTPTDQNNWCSYKLETWDVDYKPRNMTVCMNREIATHLFNIDCTDTEESDNSTLKMVITILIVLLIIIAIIVTGLVCWRKRRRVNRQRGSYAPVVPKNGSPVESQRPNGDDVPQPNSKA